MITASVLKGLSCPNFWKLLTHSFPMHPFSTPWKHQKTLRFSDVLRRQRKDALGTNGLTDVVVMVFLFYLFKTHPDKYFSFMSLKSLGIKILSSVFRNSLLRCSLMPATLFKKRLWHRCLPINFEKFLRTSFLQNTSGWLLLCVWE